MSRRESFGRAFADSLAAQWVDIRTLTVRKLTFLTFFWGLLAVLSSTAATIIHQQAAFAPYGRLATILFFGLLTATWIAIAVTQVTTDLDEGTASRKQLAAFIATVPTIVIAALLVWSTVSLTFVGLSQPTGPSAIDYASCVSGGGLVIQTNPAQCLTTTNTFTDPRGVQ